MRRVASAALLSLALSVSGCSAYRSFSYGSPEAGNCLTKCENARWACRTRCGTDSVCLEDCDAAARTCRNGCPPMAPMEPETTN